MDEADILGDRIAIMADGRLKCCGSSLFLKRSYGVGYTLTVVRKALSDDAQPTESNNAIHELVRSHVPAAESLSTAGSELAIRLPLEAAPNFQQLFEVMERESKTGQLAIDSFGISVTTLEEVFMRVERGTADVQDQNDIEQVRTIRQNSGSSVGIAPMGTQDESGNAGGLESRAFYSAKDGRVKETLVFTTHLNALLRKRLTIAKRDKKAICCQIIIPAIAVVFGLALLQVSPIVELPLLDLNADSFNPTVSNSAFRNLLEFNDSLGGVSGTFTQPTGAVVANQLGNGASVSPVTGAPGCEGTSCAGSWDPSPIGPAEQRAMSEYLISTIDGSVAATRDGASRYGAVCYPEDGSGYDYGAENPFGAYGFAVLTNASATHGAPLYINSVMNAKAKAASAQVLGTRGVKVQNHPLPLTYREKQSAAGLSSLAASQMISLSFSFIPASYAIYVVKEREVKAKHQQIISGVSLPAYWISTYIFDMATYLVPALFTIAMINAFQVEAFTKGAGLQGTIALFLLYGPAVASHTYCLSFLFKTHSAAQNAVLIVNVFSGNILSTITYVLSNLEATQDFNNNYFQYICRLFPTFCLSHGLQWLSFCSGDTCLLYTGGVFGQASPFDPDIVGLDLAYLGGCAIGYFFLALGIEYALTFPWIVSLFGAGNAAAKAEQSKALVTAQEDEDVAIERERVMQPGAVEENVVLLQGLRKVYNTKTAPGYKVAVNDLSFGIPRGECFGFLGINGAGKTTTLSILSGEFPGTSGNAFIAGHDINGNQNAIRREIGYCPQFDALVDLLTPREHLQLYARIKGIPEHALEALVNRKLKEMDLVEFEDKLAGSLSGGNKRKLSVAVAMIGDPSIVFLDEPSTGELDDVMVNHHCTRYTVLILYSLYCTHTVLTLLYSYSTHSTVLILCSLYCTHRYGPCREALHVGGHRSSLDGGRSLLHHPNYPQYGRGGGTLHPYRNNGQWQVAVSRQHAAPKVSFWHWLRDRRQVHCDAGAGTGQALAGSRWAQAGTADRVCKRLIRQCWQ
jgi:ATP-binding cassette subfamily A (ABC1) protein 3